MDQEALVERFKLNITVVSNNRCREVKLKPALDQHEQQERSIVMWSRKLELDRNVYVHESATSKKLRVVKELVPDRKNGQFELAVIGRVTAATEYVRFSRLLEYVLKV